jgi:hypothetical protein
MTHGEIFMSKHRDRAENKPDGVRWPRLLGVEQAAAYLSLSPKTIRNGLARDAERPFPVKPKRFGRRVLFDIRDLDAYVDAMPCMSGT